MAYYSFTSTKIITRKTGSWFAIVNVFSCRLSCPSLRELGCWLTYLWHMLHSDAEHNTHVVRYLQQLSRTDLN